MRYFSMFSGIGGFELGIHRAMASRCSAVEETAEDIQGHLPNDQSEHGRHRAVCVGYSEIDRYAIKIYESHFGGHKNYGDATLIDPQSLPDFDFLVGGFPCQAFSIAGKRLGFDDTRGTLFFDIARILKVKRPRLLLLENVKGLLSHDNGRTFKTILSTLVELGYDVEWQVLNSKNHGVPQNRERVFIVGHLGGIRGREVFPIGNFDEKDNGNDTGKILSYQWDFSGKGFDSQQDRAYSKDGLMGCLPSTRTENKCNVIIPVLTPNRAEKRQNGRRMKEDGEPAFTLTGQDIHGVYDGMRIRRLTPTECERLQGYPDGWTAGVSDSQRYKTLGNSVTVNVIEEIMRRI